MQMLCSLDHTVSRLSAVQMRYPIDFVLSTLQYPSFLKRLCINEIVGFQSEVVRSEAMAYVFRHIQDCHCDTRISNLDLKISFAIAIKPFENGSGVKSPIWCQ